MTQQKMWKRHNKFLIFTLCVFAGSLQAELRRAIVPADCVTVRHFLEDDFRSSIQTNSQGTAVAYLVQAPNLQSNQNDILLELKQLGAPQGQVQHLLAGADISGLQWLNDGTAVIVLAKDDGHTVVKQVEIPSGRVQVLARASQDISEYSVAEDGKTIVFAMEEPDQTRNKLKSASDLAQGYRIPFQREQVALFFRRKIFVTRRGGTGGWTAPQALSVQSPFTKGTLTSLSYALNLRLSLSPNGESLALTYLENSSRISNAWKKSPVVRDILSSIGVAQVTVVVDLSDGETHLPFEGPWAWSIPFWSRDSKSFMIASVSPVNSVWEQQDLREHRGASEAVHLFEVNVASGSVIQVRSELNGIYDRPLSWRSDDDLVLRTGDNIVSRFQYKHQKWEESSQIHLPLQGLFRNAGLASDGRSVVGDYESPATPPELFSYKEDEEQVQILAKLNPQFDELTLAPIKEVQWETSTGYRASGILLLPPDYKPGTRYPLVIHSYPAAGNFFCDSGLNHEPSFAPQPIANAGIMYLIRFLPEGPQTAEEQTHYPKGLPGLLGQVAFQADVWDSAIEHLAKDGLIDRNRVGIIGFSRSGWYTEFALTHGKTNYAAATVADNTQYSLGEYWMIHTDGVLRAWDAMYGGPPYGATLKSWLDYSISFNLPRVQTPLLMEVMGNGVAYDNDGAPPSNLALKWEVFVGLSRLGKPVEMYYYPLESHQPGHPLARLASLERNLDWYLFWLRDQERPTAMDPQQYQRWRELRSAVNAERRLDSPH
ncbi:prolyl oligopeptidase family serine peptidase [Tunturiibacter empetritectus]|uniref:Dipeptidyl aminopeptidase/acylaminoacyl peptidase n=1 Tax=Tunturiibacter lichenicola TaxID=2051959 RepID=A0A852VIC8_9BACT|nr:prolyl oligopeptidase family serine peptidase [Edaphobacter lichenicola]NYF91390.1 dipeptidyl aminopeptidase/acylaminoacyl peptidase [Edaphobacter lichenicola]